MPGSKALPILVLIRSRFLTILGMLAVALIVLELGGIWNEIHQIRNEQVKNALYSLPQERQAAMRKTPSGKRLESTVDVKGSVEIDGEVKVEEPVEVEVDH